MDMGLVTVFSFRKSRKIWSLIPKPGKTNNRRAADVQALRFVLSPELQLWGPLS